MISKKRTSGVSIAIKNSLVSQDSNEGKINPFYLNGYTIKVANCRLDFQQVFELAYHEYLQKGYISPNEMQEFIIPQDFDQETIVFLVKDKKGKPAATVTLVMSEDSVLPVESIFSNEVNQLKIDFPMIAEVSRLVIDKRFRHSKDILTQLFNYLAIYAHQVKGYDALVCQVNPRHVAFYQKLLKFDQIGDVKEYAGVNNAPAALQFLPLSLYQDEIEYMHLSLEISKKSKTLYKDFFHPNQVNNVARRIEHEFKAVCQSDKEYFRRESDEEQEVYL